MLPELVERFGSLIREAMEHVTSADKAFAYLRETGRYVPRETVREVWRTVGEKEAWTTVLETWGHFRTPPKWWTVEVPSQYAEGYQLRMEVVGVDVETGERETHIFSRMYDEPVSFEEFYADMEDILKEYEELLGQTFISFSWAGIAHYIPRKG